MYEVKLTHLIQGNQTTIQSEEFESKELAIKYIVDNFDNLRSVNIIEFVRSSGDMDRINMELDNLYEELKMIYIALSALNDRDAMMQFWIKRRSKAYMRITNLKYLLMISDIDNKEQPND